MAAPDENHDEADEMSVEPEPAVAPQPQSQASETDEDQQPPDESAAASYTTHPQPATRPEDHFDFSAKGYDPTQFTGGARAVFADEIEQAEKAKGVQDQWDKWNDQEARRQQQAQVTADYRTQGVKSYVDPWGNRVPQLNEDGSVAFKPHTGAVEYDPETGAAYQKVRDDHGNVTASDPDANAPIGTHPDQPNQLYRQNAWQAWTPLGSVEDGLQSSDPAILGAAKDANDKLQKTLLGAAHSGFQGQRDELALAHNDALTKVRAAQTQSKEINAQIDAISANPQLKQTQGGWMGTQIAASPTPEAAALQGRLKALQDQLGNLVTIMPPETTQAFREKTADLHDQQAAFTALYHQTGSVDGAEAEWRDRITAQGGDVENDPVLSALASKRAELGMRTQGTQGTQGTGSDLDLGGSVMDSYLEGNARTNTDESAFDLSQPSDGKLYRFNRAGQIRFSQEIQDRDGQAVYVPQYKAVAQALADGKIDVKTASDLVRSRADFSGAAIDNGIGEARDAATRAALETSNVLNRSMEGITRFAGIDSIANYFKQAGDIGEQAMAGQLGGGADVVNPALARGPSAFMGKQVGGLVAMAPALVASEAIAPLAAAGSVAGTAMAALKIGTLAPKLVGVLPLALQSAGQAYSGAYDQTKSAGGSDAAASHDGFRASLGTAPGLFLYMFTGELAHGAMKMLPIAETPFAQFLGTSGLNLGANMAASAASRKLEGGNAGDVGESLPQDFAFAVHSGLGAIAAAKYLPTARAIDAGTHPEVKMLRAVEATGTLPAAVKTAAGKQADALVAGARDFLKQGGFKTVADASPEATAAVQEINALAQSTFALYDPEQLGGEKVSDNAKALGAIDTTPHLEALSKVDAKITERTKDLVAVQPAGTGGEEKLTKPQKQAANELVDLYKQRIGLAGAIAQHGALSRASDAIDALSGDHFLLAGRSEADIAATQDAARGMLKVALGKPLDALTAAERQAVEAPTEDGTPRIDKAGGKAVLTDGAMSRLRALVPEAEPFLPKSEDAARGNTPEEQPVGSGGQSPASTAAGIDSPVRALSDTEMQRAKALSSVLKNQGVDAKLADRFAAGHVSREGVSGSFDDQRAKFVGEFTDAKGVIGKGPDAVAANKALHGRLLAADEASLPAWDVAVSAKGGGSETKLVRVRAANAEEAKAKVARQGVGMVRDAARVPEEASTAKPVSSPQPPKETAFTREAIKQVETEKGEPMTDRERQSVAHIAGLIEPHFNRWKKAFEHLNFTLESRKRGGADFDADSRTLTISLADVLRHGRDYTDPAMAANVMSEEAIHAVTTHLEASGAIDLTGLYRMLPDNIRAALEEAYKPASTDFQKAHEFWRMWMQGDLALSADGFSIRGKAITEQVNSGFLDKIRQSLAKLLGFFRGMEAQLRAAGMDEATIAEVLRAQALIRAKVKEVDGLASRASKEGDETSAKGQNEPATGGAGENPDLAGGSTGTAGGDGRNGGGSPEDGGTSGAEGAPLRAIRPEQRAQLARKLDLPQGAVGNLSTVTQNGRVVNVAYFVQEAADARPSHDAQGNPTKGYDQSLQPRDRSLPAYRQQEQNHANTLDFEKAAFFPGTQIPATTADLGVPIMTDGGDTLTGNGREIGIKLAYEQGTPAARKYKGLLLRNAERFGVDPKAVGLMKEPILKRVIVDPMDRDALMRFSQDSNEGVSMASNAMEMAGRDGSRVTPGLLSLFDPNYALDSGRNADFVRAYARDVIGGAEGNEANLTRGDLARRIRMGIFAYAYGMDETGRAAIERMAGDESDAGGKTITNGLLTVAPIVARMKTDISSGDLHDLDISPAISRAAQDISETLRNRPAKKPADVALQGLLDKCWLFESDPLVRSVLEFLVGNRTNRGAIEEGLSNYVEAVFRAGNPKEMDMFGEREKPDALALWKLATAPGRMEEREQRHVLAAQALNEDFANKSVYQPEGHILRARNAPGSMLYSQSMVGNETSDDILRKNDNWVQAAWLRQHFKRNLNEVPHEELVAKMAEWRDTHPDVETSRKAYPLPGEFIEGNSLRESEFDSENSRRSLEAYNERSGGEKATAASADGFRAAVAPLVAESERTGRVFSPKLLDLVGAQGGEHSVVFLPGRVLKFTEPDIAGGVLEFKGDGEPYVTHGTVPEYLRQLEVNRAIAADDTRVEGVMKCDDGAIRIVTSQTARHGVKPSYREAANAFMDAGYMPVDQEYVIGQEGPELWWNKQDNIVIADAKPDNLVKADDGEIIWIDIKAFQPTGKALEWIKENSDPLTLAKFRASHPEVLGSQSLVDEGAHEAATSPLNDESEPTQAQKEAGNYRMGHVRVGGLDVTIENPAGSVRSGVSADGNPWSTEMASHYGYIKGTLGKDGDHVDAFIKPGTPEAWKGTVFVVNQIDPESGKFDEHKAVIGAGSMDEARKIYSENYSADWKGLKSIVPMPMDEFRAWVNAGQRRNEAKPLDPADRFKAMLPIAEKAAARFDNIPGVEAGDRQQTARIALAKAVREFDPADGRAFEPYARASINNALRDLYRKQGRNLEDSTLDAPLSGDSEVSGKDLLADHAADVREQVQRREAYGMVRDAVGEMPERLQKVIGGILEGRTLEDIGAELGVTKQGVGNLAGAAMRRLRGKLGERGVNGSDSVLAAQSMHERVEEMVDSRLAAQASRDSVGEFMALINSPDFHDFLCKASSEEPGKRTIGRPDLALGASHPEMMAMDEARKSRERPEKQADWRESAEGMLAHDYAGTVRMLMKRGLTGGTLTPEETKAAQMIVAREMALPLTPERSKRIQALLWSYRETGTEAGRQLAARIDPFQTPEERHREFLAKTIFTPPPSVRADVERATTPEAKQQVLDKDAARIDQVRATLAKMGFSFEDILGGGVALRLKGAAVVKDIVSGFDEARQKAFGMIQGGDKTFAQIAKATGLSEAAVKAVKAEFIDQMRAKHFEKFRAGLKADDVEQGRLFAQGGGVDDAQAEAEFQKALRQMGIVPDSDQGKMKVVLQKKKLFRPPAVPYDGRVPSDESVPFEDRTQNDLLNPERNKARSPLDTGDIGSTEGRQRDLDIRTPHEGPQPDEAPVGNTEGKQPSLGIPENFDQHAWQEAMVRRGADLGNPDDVVRLARNVQAAGGNKADMLYEYWINSILSGPTNHFAYKMSTMGNMAWNFTVQRGMEAMLNQVYRNADAAQFGEFQHIARGFLPGLIDGLRLGVRAFGNEYDAFHFDHSEASKQAEFFKNVEAFGARDHAIPGQAGRVIRMPLRCLYFIDNLMKGWIGRMEAGAQAYRIAKSEGHAGEALSGRMNELIFNPTSPAWERAKLASEELTFQEPLRGLADGGNMFDNAVKQFSSARNKSHLLGFFFPFIRLPYNIFRTGIRKSPLGSVNALSQLASAGFYKIKEGRPVFESYSAARQVHDFAEQAIAWGTAAMLYSAVTGDPDDDKKGFVITGSMPRTEVKRGERELNQRAYGGPYEIRIGGRNGTSFSYGKFEPFATVLGTLADSIRTIKQQQNGAPKEKALDNLWGYFIAQAQEKTFLKGFDTVSRLLDGSSSLAQEGKRMAMEALVPNLVRQPLRNSDDYLRDTKHASPGYQLLPTAGNAEPKIDVYGREVPKDGNSVSRMFFPEGAKPYPELEKADRLILAWNQKHPVETWAPEAVQDHYTIHDSRTGKPETVKMTSAEYKRVSVLAGHTVRAMLAGQITESQIRNPSEDAIKMLKTTFEAARKQAKEAVFGSKIHSY